MFLNEAVLGEISRPDFVTEVIGWEGENEMDQVKMPPQVHRKDSQSHNRTISSLPMIKKNSAPFIGSDNDTENESKVSMKNSNQTLPNGAEFG